MKQKQRYELQVNKKNFIEIFDNVRDEWLTEDDICGYLNDYDEEMKEFKQVAVDALNNVRNTLRFHTYNIKDNQFGYTRTMYLWTDINEIIDKQIESLKGE